MVRQAAHSAISRRRFLRGVVAGAAAAAGLPARAVQAAAARDHLVVALADDWQLMDPAAHYLIAAFTVHRHIYEPLVENDLAGNLVPRLAEAWRIVDDLTWEFKLRQRVRAHNGEEFTAESVKFTLERIIDPATKSAQAFLWKPLDRVEVRDPYTAVVRTKEPFGALLANLTLTEMLPARAAREPGFFQKPVGLGPFKVVRWARGDRIELEAHPHYWAGAPKVGRLTFRHIPEISTRVAALKAGEVDIIERLFPDQIASLEAHPDTTVQHTVATEQQFIGFNGGKKPFSDARVRQAMNYAVNREALIRDLLLGYARVPRSSLPAGVFGHNSRLQPYPHDPAKARALLAEAGYPGGFDMELISIRGLYIKGLEIAQAVAAQLGEVGVRVRINEVEAARMREMRAAGNFDAIMTGWATMNRDADFGMWQPYHTEGSRRMWRYSNGEVDALIQRGQKTLDQRQRGRPYEQAQELIWRDAPLLWLYWTVNINGVRRRVQNFRIRPDHFTLVRDVSLGG
jgi:peptide/nickel transport system substrate-binding protein